MQASPTLNALSPHSLMPSMDLLLWILVPLTLLLLLKPFSRRNLPPGPYPWPIIGNMMSLLKGSPHVELMKLAGVHGPLMLVKLGMQPVIVASTPESAMEILRTHDKALSGRFVSHSLRLKDHIKHSVAWGDCTDGWKNLRRIAKTQLFSTKMLDAQVHVRQQKVGEMVDYISGQEGGEIKITEVVFGALLNILGHAVFSKDVFGYGEKGDKAGMQKLIRELQYIAASPNLADFYPFLGGLDFQGLLRGTEERLNKMVELWKETVKERRANRDPFKHDFLEVLLDNDFDDTQINAMFLVSMIPLFSRAHRLI